MFRFPPPERRSAMAITHPPAQPPGPADSGDLTERQLDILRFVQQFSADRGYPPSMREIGEQFGIRSTNGVSDHLRALERKGYLQRSGHLSRSLTVVKQPADRNWQGDEVERTIERFAEPELGGPPLPPNVVALRRPPAGDRPGVGDRLVRRDSGDLRNRADLRGHQNDLRAHNSAVVPVLGRVAAGQPLLAVEDAEETLVVDQFLLGGPGEVFALRVVGESMIDAGILPGDYLFVRKRDTARNGEIVVAMLDGEATVKRYFVEGDRVRLQPENRTMSPIYVRRGDLSAFTLVGAVVGVYRRM